MYIRDASQYLNSTECIVGSSLCTQEHVKYKLAFRQGGSHPHAPRKHEFSWSLLWSGPDHLRSVLLPLNGHLEYAHDVQGDKKLNSTKNISPIGQQLRSATSDQRVLMSVSEMWTTITSPRTVHCSCSIKLFLWPDKFVLSCLEAWMKS